MLANSKIGKIEKGQNPVDIQQLKETAYLRIQLANPAKLPLYPITCILYRRTMAPTRSPRP